jgi:hypothetical protein
MPPVLKQQEVPHDSPESRNFFQPSADKPFVATPAAIREYQHETIIRCLSVLQEQARRFNGIDYLQVFVDVDKTEDLWFIEDGPGGAITALLPSDY